MIRLRRRAFESVNLSKEDVNELVDRLTPFENLSYSNQIDKFVTKPWMGLVGRLESGLYNAFDGVKGAPDRDKLVRQTDELIRGLESYIVELNDKLEELYEIKNIIEREF